MFTWVLQVNPRSISAISEITYVKSARDSKSLSRKASPVKLRLQQQCVNT